MRSILFSAVAGILMLLSCNDASNTGSSGEQSKNLEAARAIANAFGTGNTAAIDSFVADDFVDHTDRGDKKGKDSLKAMIQFIRSNFTDMKMETMSEVADKEYVFQWMRYTGNSNGAGMPPGPYDMKAIEVTKFRDGKAVEHWAYMDMQEMMKWMAPSGQQPPAGAATATPTTDTTNKAKQ